MPITKSLPQVLKSLTPVGKADNVFSVASADRINAIQDAIRLIVRGDNIVSGDQIRKKSGDGFVMLSGRQPARAGFGGLGNFPWKMIITTDSSNNPFVKCLPGTINNIMPSNMFTPLAITPDETWYVILHVETDGYRPTAALLRVDTTPPGPFDNDLNTAPATFEVLIGVIVNLGKFQMIDSLLYATPDDILDTVVDSPAPGRPLYDQNLSWFIEQY